MIKKLLFLLLLAAPYVTSAQITHETLNSSKLGETREIKIQLPRNYSANKEKSYPVMVVLDGDYLFEPVAGNVDYYSYWEDIPEMIVVGINQASSRDDDAYYDEQMFLPAGKGAAFFEFIGMELLPHIEKKYRTAPFRVIIGHDFTSNFMNYYLLKEKPLFQGYINLSPDLAPEMTNRLTSSLERSSNRTWYYLATGSEDIPQLKEGILGLDEKLKNLNNKKITYQFDNFEGATHYSLVGMAIPKLLSKYFRFTALYPYRIITAYFYKHLCQDMIISWRNMKPLKSFLGYKNK
jgi:uncharacterized protein